MNVEREILLLKQKIDEIHAVLVLGKKPMPPGVAEYKHALQAMVEGDRSLINDYLAKGGKVYPPEEVYPDAPTIRRGVRKRPPMASPSSG